MARLAKTPLLLAALALGACAEAVLEAPPDDPRQPRAASPGGPGSVAFSSGYLAERELLLDLIEKEREPEERAALAMRLADLAEEEAARVGRELEDLEERRAEMGHRPEHVRRRGGLELLRRALVDEEMRLLGLVARDHPGSARTDEALYRLGYAMLEHDQPDVALRYLRVLIADHPRSRYVPHAYLAFADHYFARERIDEAVELYEKVLTFDDADAAPQAHFKLGWCWIGRGDHRRALESFLAVLETAGRSDGPIADLLRTEAEKDLVRALAHVGDPEEALELFERIAPERIAEMLDRLSRAYFDAGRYEEAIAVNREIAGRLECSPAQARSQLVVFEARLMLGERDLAMEEAERLAGILVHLSECLPAAELRDLAEASVRARRTLERQAERYRAEFESTGEPAAQAMADELECLAESF